jgi:hypothetical protein
MLNKRVLTCAAATLAGAIVMATPASAAPTKIPDFNGDGLPDLAVGAPFATVRGVYNAGAVGIVYGKSTGLDPANVKAINQAMAVVPGVPQPEDNFGDTLRSGDFDGDGFADLAVTSGENRTAETSGLVHLLFGGKAGFTRGITVAPAVSDEVGAFGHNLAVGDFNKDGFADLYAGGNDDPGLGYNAGYVLYGKSGLHQPGQAKLVKLTGSTVQGDWLKGEPDAGDVTGDGYADLVVPRWLNNQSDVLLYKGSASGLSPAPVQRVAGGGLVTAIGDTDKDGYADVAVGNWITTVASKPYAGHVRVWYGSAAGLNAARGSVVLHQETPRIPDVAEGNDGFGQDVALGDVDKDGRADLAIGVPGESYGAKHLAGQVTVVFGGVGGIVPATAKIQSFSQDSPGVGDTLEAYDHFGSATDLRDYDRDGRADLVVSSIYDNGGEGVVQVLKGTATGLTGSGSSTFGPADVAIGHGFAYFGDGLDG